MAVDAPVRAAFVCTMKPEGGSLIGFGSSSSAGKKFRAIDPSRAESIEPDFVSADAAALEHALKLAADAASFWAQLSGARRNKFLRLIADKLEANAAPLAARAMSETALSESRLRGEIARTAGQLRLYGEVAEVGDWLDARIETADPGRKPLPKPDHRSMMRPVGPVAIFGSSNFPFAYSVAGGDTASAFAAGCPVLVKAHAAHPGTSELVGRLVVEAVKESDFPEGSFALLFDSGYEIGQALVKSARVKAVGFTGSLKGGRALMDLAAARPEPIPVYAEMGSINPVFILPSALARRAELAEQLHQSATVGVGQFCTNPGLIVLQRTEPAQHFVGELVQRLSATSEAPMLTEGIQRNFVTGTTTRRNVPGVRQLVQGNASAPCAAAPVWFETDVKTFRGNASLSEEIFGPSSLVVWGDEENDLLETARNLEGSLTATIHGSPDDPIASELAACLAERAGRLIWNGFPTGVEVSHAIVHGGPYPSTSDGGRSTSVGSRAIARWGRLVCYQHFDDALLPPALRDANPLGLRRLVNGSWSREPVKR